MPESTEESSSARASRLSISVSSGLAGGTTISAVWLRRFGRFEGGTSTSDSSLARARRASQSSSSVEIFAARVTFLGLLLAVDLMGQVRFGRFDGGMVSVSTLASSSARSRSGSTADSSCCTL